MGLTSLPIEAAARAARIFGAALLVVGSLVLLALLVVADTARGRFNWLPLVIVDALLYFLPGGFFFLLAARIDAGRRWAVITSMILSALVVTVVAVQTLVSGVAEGAMGIGAQACVDVLVGSPPVYLLVRSWAALPEFRFLRPPTAGVRPRGFAVLPPPRPPPDRGTRI